MEINLIFIIIYSVLFALLAWRNLNWALALTIFALPSYLVRWQIGFLPATLLEVMILISFLVWLTRQWSVYGIKKLLSKIRGLLASWFWPIVLFLVTATIAVFVSPNTIRALGLWKAYFIEPILFLIVFLAVFKTKKDLNLVFQALAWSALVISALAIYQKFTGWAIPNHFWAALETRRVTTIFGYPNANGLFLAPLIVLFFGLLVSQFFEHKKTTILILSGAILSLLTIILAVSKGAWLGVLAGLIFFGFFYKSPHFSHKKIRLITSVIVMVLILLILIIPSVRSFTLEHLTLQSTSTKVRVGLWSETLALLRDYPVFGAGLAGFQTALTPYHQAQYIEIYLYPHNVFLNFYTELGLLGLLIFIWLIIKFFKTYVLHPRPYSLILISTMIALLIHGLVDVPYFKNDLAILFWLLIGLITISHPEVKRRE